MSELSTSCLKSSKTCFSSIVQALWYVIPYVVSHDDKEYRQNCPWRILFVCKQFKSIYETRLSYRFVASQFPYSFDLIRSYMAHYISICDELIQPFIMRCNELWPTGFRTDEAVSKIGSSDHKEQAIIERKNIIMCHIRLNYMYHSQSSQTRELIDHYFRLLPDILNRPLGTELKCDLFGMIIRIFNKEDRMDLIDLVMKYVFYQGMLNILMRSMFIDNVQIMNPEMDHVPLSFYIDLSRCHDHNTIHRWFFCSKHYRYVDDRIRLIQSLQRN
jgi:hypothetical protein